MVEKLKHSKKKLEKSCLHFDKKIQMCIPTLQIT